MRVDQRKVVLSIDEMVIKPSFDFDPRSESLVGHTTMPLDKDKRATHVLVAMLGSITSRWKQVVGYWFTENSVPPASMGAMVHDLLREAAAIDLDVIALISDMGPANQAMNK